MNSGFQALLNSESLQEYSNNINIHADPLINFFVKIMKNRSSDGH